MGSVELPKVVKSTVWKASKVKCTHCRHSWFAVYSVDFNTLAGINVTCPECHKTIPKILNKVT